jgi:hypothetical protein
MMFIPTSINIRELFQKLLGPRICFCFLITKEILLRRAECLTVPDRRQTGRSVGDSVSRELNRGGVGGGVLAASCWAFLSWSGWKSSSADSWTQNVFMCLEVLCLFLFNWAPLHGGVLGEWRYSSTHCFTSALDGGWVVSFTPRPLYHQGNSPCYPLDRRFGGPQSRSGRGGEEKNSQPPSGIEP